MSRFSDMVNAMRNNYGSSGNTAQPVNNVQVNYANQQAMIQRQEQARMREEERRRRLEEERRKREEERKRKEEERKAEEQRRKEQENIRAEEARAKAQKALEKSKENNFQQVQQPKQQVQQRSEETSASNARRLAQQSLGDNKQSVQRELANRALESSKSLEKSEQSIRRLEEKRNKEVQDNLDFIANYNNSDFKRNRRETIAKRVEAYKPNEVEARQNINVEIRSNPNWAQIAKQNGYSDEDIQLAYDSWQKGINNLRPEQLERIYETKDALTGVPLDDPSRFLPNKKNGNFLHDAGVVAQNTLGKVGSGLTSSANSLGYAIGGLTETINPDLDLYERIVQQAEDNGNNARIRRLNNVSPDNIVEKYVYDIAQNLGSNYVPRLAGGALGGETGALTLSAITNFGAKYNEMIERGLDPTTAFEYALASSAVETATEKFGSSFISNYIPGVPGQSIGLKDILGEGVEEAESKLADPILDSLILGDAEALKQYGTGDYWKDLAYQSALGAGSGLVSGMVQNPSGTVQTLRNDIESIVDNRLNNVANEGLKNIIEEKTIVEEQQNTPTNEEIATEITNQSFSPMSDLRGMPEYESAREAFYNATLNRLNNPTQETQELLNAYKNFKAQEQARTPLETPEQLELFSGEEVPTVENFVDQNNTTVDNENTDDYFKPEDMFDENGFFVNPTNGFEKTYNEILSKYNEVRAKYGIGSTNETEQRNVATEAVKQSLEEELSQTELANDPIVQDYVNTLASDTAERVMKVAQGAKQTARGNKKSGKVDITSDTQEMYRKKIESRENDVLYEELSKKGTFNQAQQDLDSKGLDKALEDFYKGAGLSDDTGFRVKDALGVIGRNVIDGVERTFGNRRGEIKRDAKLYKYVADSVAIRDALELQKAELLTKIQRDGYTITEEYNIDGDLEAKLYDGDRRVGIKTAKQYEAELNRLNNELANVYYVQKTIEGNAGLILGAFSGDTVLTPRMQLKNINDVVDKINIELHKKFRSQFQNGKLSDVVVDNELLEQFRNAKTQEERNATIEQIQENIASQIPATVGEKINALRYTNMLFNTGTFIRNALGNAMGQGVYLNRDLIGVLVEKYLDARGYVRYDKLNTSNEYDRSLIRFTQDNLIDVIKNDYADWKETGGNKRNFFKSRGYSGALLNKLVGWKGETFNLDGDEVGLDRVVNAVANNLKANKALVADDGSVSGVDFNQLVRDGYNQAQKQFIDSGELRFRKQGSTNNQIDKVRKVIEMLHGDEKTVGSKFTTYGNIDANTFEGGIRAKTRKKIFGNGLLGKIGNWATNTTDYIMNDSVFGDKAFTNFRNTQSLMRALNAQGLTIKSVDKNGVILTRDGVELSKAESKALIDKLDTQAYQDARESVYRDFNSTAQALNNLSDSSTLYQLLFGGNIPFTTTPFNIIRRIVEFSPFGLANTMREYHLVQSGEISASTYINNLSKRMTGAGIGLLGAFLAHLGMIRAKGDKKDEKEHKYEVNNGLQDYSLVLPNGTYSLGWGAPATAILMYGAWVYELFARNGYDLFDTGNDLLNNWGDVFEPLTEMTMLSGLHDTIEAVGDDGLKGLLLQTVENYAGQFTPTMGSKINKIFDDVTRSTWSDNPIERTFRKSVNNIPLLDLAWSRMTGDHYLKPSLNNRGEEIKNVGGNALGRLAYNFLSPGTYKENTMNQNMTDASFTNVDDELLRLYESKEVDASKKQYLLPYKVYSFNVDGEKMNLTAQEKDEYNKEYLQNVRKQVEAIMSSPLYQNMTDSERANLITGVQNYYYNKIKQNYFDKVAPGGYQLSGANQAIEGLTDIGVEPYQVLYYKSITNMKDKDGNTINNSGALQVREAMESAGVYDDILNAYRTGKFDNLNSVGLNNKVAKMSDSEYMYNMELLDNGLLGATQSKTNEEKRDSFNSAYEENQALEKKYSDIGVNTQSIYRTNDVKSKYDDNGKAITYSQDLLAREAMGEDFNKLIEAVQDGRISIDEAIKDTGIGKTVFMMSEDEFQKDLGYLNDGTWTNATYNKLMNKKATWGTYKNYSGKSSKTSSSSKSSGYTKSRKRSSGGTSSRVSNKVKSVSSSSKSTKAKASELSTYMKTVLKEQDKGAKSTGNAVKKSMENAIKNLRKSDQELYNEIMSSHNKNVEALRKELGLKKQ